MPPVPTCPTDRPSRDQILRRADWRWLLPQPYFARALCLGSGDLRASLHAVAGDVVGRVDDPTRALREREYDLVLVTGADRRTLDRAHRALRPGGVLYAECDPMSDGTVRRLRSRVLSAGFVDTRLVTRWGTPNADDAWVPLDSRAARDYVLLRHPVPARHPLRRLWLKTRRRSARVLHAVGRARTVALVARAGLATVDPEARAIPGAIAPWWVVRAREVAPGGAEADWLLLTPGRVADAKVVGLMFASNARWPSVAVKLGRTAAAVERCSRGFRVLERLRDAHITALGYAPEPYAELTDETGRSVATVERAVNGCWLDTAVRANTLVRHVEQTTACLITLALATRGPPREDTWERLLRPTVSRFSECAAGLVDGALLDDATALIGGVRALPTVLEHHDFRPWNIYVTPEPRLVAFDWDNADRAGVPALDLLQCHAYLAFTVDRALATGRYVSSHVRRDSGALGRARRACLARYADAVGLDDGAIRVIRAFTWMGLAADEVGARHAAGSPITPADVRRSLLALWEVEARAALG